MSGTQTRDQEIATYVEGVRAALADLPEPRRAELVGDLYEHLAEFAAEDPAPLTDRLGAPARYAAELRASLGAVPAPARPEPPPRAGLAKLLVQLRPAWWVLRGLVSGLLLFVWLGFGATLPIILFFAAAGTVGSVLLGRASSRFGTIATRAVVVGNILVVAAMVSLIFASPYIWIWWSI